MPIDTEVGILGAALIALTGIGAWVKKKLDDASDAMKLRLSTVEAESRLCDAERENLKLEMVQLKADIRSLARHGPNGYMALIADEHGTIITATESCYDLIGWHPSELTGLNIKILIATEEDKILHEKKLAEAAKEGIRRPETVTIIGRCNHKAGHNFLVSIFLVKRYRRGAPVFVAILRPMLAVEDVYPDLTKFKR